MATHPLILLPAPRVETRQLLHGGGGGFRKPTPEQQRQRLDDKFQQIARSFNDIQVTAQGLEPEQVIVLETIGQSVAGLAAAAARIPGLEWLAERDLGEIEPMGGFEAETEAAKSLPVRLYALFSGQQAMNDLIALWRSWYTDPGQRAKRYFGPFKGLFVHLKDVRRAAASVHMKHCPGSSMQKGPVPRPDSNPRDPVPWRPDRTSGNCSAAYGRSPAQQSRHTVA
jgi:hypothetical protein